MIMYCIRRFLWDARLYNSIAFLEIVAHVYSVYIRCKIRKIIKSVLSDDVCL